MNPKIDNLQFHVQIKFGNKIVADQHFVHKGALRNWLLHYSPLEPKAKDKIQKHLHQLNYSTGGSWKKYGSHFLSIRRSQTRTPLRDIDKAKLIPRKVSRMTRGVIDLNERISRIVYGQALTYAEKFYPLQFKLTAYGTDPDVKHTKEDIVMAVLSQLAHSGITEEEFDQKLENGIWWDLDGTRFWAQEASAWKRKVTTLQTLKKANKYESAS